jgi:hypothetical protein
MEAKYYGTRESRAFFIPAAGGAGNAYLLNPLLQAVQYSHQPDLISPIRALQQPF